MIYKTTFIFLLLCVQCEGQWIKFDPVRTPFDRRCKILTDVSSHSNQTYSDEDGPHVAHEVCHFANSTLKNRLFNQGYRRHNTFYVLHNVAYLVKEPSFKLNDLAQNIPAKYRGVVYNLYLIKGQEAPPGRNTEGWNNQPCYILDEHTAYTVGTMCAIEMKNQSRIQDSGERMFETLIYCHFLKKMAKQKDITEFVDWQTGRCEKIYKNIIVTNPRITHNYNLLQEVK